VLRGGVREGGSGGLRSPEFLENREKMAGPRLPPNLTRRLYRVFFRVSGFFPLCKRLVRRVEGCGPAGFFGRFEGPRFRRPKTGPKRAFKTGQKKGQNLGQNLGPKRGPKRGQNLGQKSGQNGVKKVAQTGSKFGSKTGPKFRSKKVSRNGSKKWSKRVKFWVPETDVRK